VRKFLLLSIVFILISGGKLTAQLDTLVTRSHKKIVCKIAEITETQIRYITTDYLGEHFEITDRTEFLSMTLSSGFKEILNKEEPKKQLPSDIIRKFRAIKIEPFSPLMDKVVIGYEQMLKMGRNLEVKLGYINNSMSPFDVYPNSYNLTYFTTGGFLKVGIKFIFGQDYFIQDIKYKHPLNGFYFRLDAVAEYFDVHGYDFYYNPNSLSVRSPFYAPSPNAGWEKTDLETKAFGIISNIGYQFIIKNIISVDYYMGFGLGAGGFSFTNKRFDGTGRYDYNYKSSANYYYGFTILKGNIGPCVNAGLTVGVVLR
jgi:hypothetical protein